MAQWLNVVRPTVNRPPQLPFLNDKRNLIFEQDLTNKPIN
jgi:hypothetical protein